MQPRRHCRLSIFLVSLSAVSKRSLQVSVSVFKSQLAASLDSLSLSLKFQVSAGSLSRQSTVDSLNLSLSLQTSVHGLSLRLRWFALIFGYGAEYFAFIAASVAGQTYLLDAYPTRTGAVLTLVCVGRGLISFGMSYSLVSTTDALGHLGAYSMYAGVMAFFGLCFIALYFTGKRLRNWTMKFIVDELDGKPHIG